MGMLLWDVLVRLHLALRHVFKAVEGCKMQC